MTTAIQKDLKKRMRQADITIKDVALELNIPYSTVSSWLNGFAPLPTFRKLQIEKIIKKSNS